MTLIFPIQKQSDFQAAADLFLGLPDHLLLQVPQASAQGYMADMRVDQPFDP